jgi:hypothetical protein
MWCGSASSGLPREGTHRKVGFVGRGRLEGESAMGRVVFATVGASERKRCLAIMCSAEVVGCGNVLSAWRGLLLVMVAGMANGLGQIAEEVDGMAGSRTAVQRLNMLSQCRRRCECAMRRRQLVIMPCNSFL